MCADDSIYLGAFFRLFDDLINVLPEYVVKHATRDRLTCKRRSFTEGMSFITKTLPRLGKHLESALEHGTFEPFVGIAKEKGRTTPLFLTAMFKEVFDDEGTILPHPNPDCIRAIRQVCYFLYKLEAGVDVETERKAIKDFVSVDQSLEKQGNWSREERLLLTIARSFIVRILSGFDPADIRPRPGPGASASGTHKSERYEPLVHYEQIHKKYPYYRYFYMGSLHLADRRNAYLALPRKQHGRSLLRLVHKDSRGPRIICMEEQEYMFLQQGLADALRHHIENNVITQCHVNFGCQEINRELARRGSINGEYATLDMKEASDRISRVLVRELFSGLPELCDCLCALSVPVIELPDGTLHTMAKFAPMGSSLCFPIMSIVHYALAVACIHMRTARPTAAIAKDLYVYGDDIICRTEDVPHLFYGFPKFDLIFNQGKSFYRGDFRESCGLDAFQGWDVTPQRFKKRFFDGQDPSDIRSAMDMVNALRSAKYDQTSRFLRCALESRYGTFPVVSKDSPFFGWHADENQQVISHDLIDVVMDGSRRNNDVLNRYFVTKADRAAIAALDPQWDSALQQLTVKALVMETKSDASMAGGWEQLMRSNLDSLRSSVRLDGRFARHTLSYERLPYHDLCSPRSTWLPSVIIR